MLKTETETVEQLSKRIQVGGIRNGNIQKFDFPNPILCLKFSVCASFVSIEPLHAIRANLSWRETFVLLFRHTIFYKTSLK